MKHVLIIIVLVFLSGCATHLTEPGKRIRVTSVDDSKSLLGCELLDRVTGESRSFLVNGEYGVIYATNDVRNKAAAIPHADTVRIITGSAQVLGGEVTGDVYNCSGDSHRQSKAAIVTTTNKGSVADAPAQVDTNNIFQKTKKCQDRGGVWLNSLCVIQVD